MNTNDRVCAMRCHEVNVLRSLLTDNIMQSPIDEHRNRKTQHAMNNHFHTCNGKRERCVACVPVENHEQVTVTMAYGNR